jgi:hypothetical protein
MNLFVKPRTANVLDAFGSEKTHLTITGTGVGITVETMIFDQHRLLHAGFACPALPADGNGNNPHPLFPFRVVGKSVASMIGERFAGGFRGFA